MLRLPGCLFLQGNKRPRRLRGAANLLGAGVIFIRSGKKELCLPLFWLVPSSVKGNGLEGEFPLLS